MSVCVVLSVRQNGPAGTNLSLLSRNPLAATHEFRQACHACYSRIGQFWLPALLTVRLTCGLIPPLSGLSGAKDVFW